MWYDKVLVDEALPSAPLVFQRDAQDSSWHNFLMMCGLVTISEPRKLHKPVGFAVAQ